MSDKPILIGNDHGGYELKCAIVAHLTQLNIPVGNVGTDSPAVVRYPYYAARVAGAISRGEAERDFHLLHRHRHEHHGESLPPASVRRCAPVPTWER